MKQNKSQKKSSTAQARNVPAAIAVRSNVTKPAMKTSRDGVTISRREFVGTVTNGAMTGFALTSLSTAIPGYDLNPGCGIMFPWLSTIANSYERFRFTRIKLEFIPGQATSTAGRFYAAVDYDYDDTPNIVSKTEMMGNATAIEMSVWQPASLELNPRMLNRDLPYRYVSTTSRTSVVDMRFCHAGFVMLAYDTTVANLLMDMWVEYEVELVTPVLDNYPVQDTSSNLFSYVTTGATTNVTNAVGTTFAGALTPSPQVSQGDVQLVTAANGTVPVLAAVLGGTTLSLPKAIDISGLRSIGTLMLESMYNVTGVTPSTLLGTNHVYTVWAVFDWLGTYLGKAADAGVKSSVVGGPRFSGEVATASAYVKNATSLAVKTLYSVFPTARYLAPYIVNDVAALGAGNSVFGFMAFQE